MYRFVTPAGDDSQEVPNTSDTGRVTSLAAQELKTCFSNVRAFDMWDVPHGLICGVWAQRAKAVNR